MSLAPVLGLTVLLNIYIALRLLPSLPGPVSSILLVLALVALSLTIPLGLAARRLARPPLADRLAWAGMLALGLFSSLLVFTLLRDMLLVLAALVAWIEPRLATTGLAALSAGAVPLLGLLASALGAFNARRTAQVVDVDVPIDGLPAALHGFTIAQISDIHVGPTIKAPYLQGIVDAVNRLQADMVAITGDWSTAASGSWAAMWRRWLAWRRATEASSSPATMSTTRARPPGSPSCAGSV